MRKQTNFIYKGKAYSIPTRVALRAENIARSIARIKGNK
jgi:hypothetical protein